MSDIRHDEHNQGTGFEREDLGGGPIFGFIISVVVLGVLIYYVIWGMFHFLDAYDRQHQQNLSPMVEVEKDTREPSYAGTADKITREFPQPRLEENERTELNDFRYEEEQQLNSSGWIDQSAGVAHIPITRAMQLIAERGLPTVPKTGTVPTSPVNMAKAAAATSDTSNVQKNPAQKSGKSQ